MGKNITGKIIIASNLILVSAMSGCNSSGGSSESLGQLNVPSSVRDERPACLSTSASIVGLSDTAIQCNGNASVHGSVVLLGGSTLTLNGNAQVTDQVYAHSSNSVVEHGNATVGSINLEDLTDHEPAVLDFIDRLGTLTETQHIDSITHPTMITGNGGLNVIRVEHGISLAASDGFLLSGGANDQFVVIVAAGGITLSGNASIIASADLSPRRVLFVIEGTQGLTITGNGSAIGTYVSANAGAKVSGNGSIVGAFVAAGSIQLSGNGLTFTPAAWCPEIDVNPTPTPSPSDTITPSPSPSPSDSATPDPSPSPSDSGSPSPSPSPTDSGTPTPSPSPSNSGGPGVLGV